MKDMSSEKFPRIPRPNENVQGTDKIFRQNWSAYVNKEGPEGSLPIIQEAFAVNLNRDEGVTDNGEPEREAEPGLAEGPECR